MRGTNPMHTLREDYRERWIKMDELAAAAYTLSKCLVLRGVLCYNLDDLQVKVRRMHTNQSNLEGFGGGGGASV